MSATCHTCKRELREGETAWAQDWTVIGEDYRGARRETRYTCDDCEARSCMTYIARPSNFGAQLAYRRDIARRGLAAVIAPYSLSPAVTIPAQRRRSVRTEVAA